MKKFDIQIWNDPRQREVLLEEIGAKGFAHNFEAVFQTRPGDCITCLLSANKIDIDRTPHLLTVARNISDRKLFEK
jgi:hypothetical protein